MADDQNQTPPAKKPEKKTVRVRVGKEALMEGGEFRAPGSEFDCPAERVKALGKLVEVTD